MAIHTEKVRVTPTQAAKWLLKNNFNRPRNRARVMELAREMMTGNWKFNGDTIRFAGDELIDGQHRLAACVAANTPFDTLVVTGLDRGAFNTIDTGKLRTAGDTFAVLGEKNYTALAASLAIVHLYYEGQATYDSKLTTRGRMPNRAYEELLEKYPAIRESVAWAGNNTTPLVAWSMLGALNFIFGRINKADRDRFMDSLTHGTNIEPGSPMARLMGVLVENASSSTKVTRGMMFGMILKAWNAMRSGKSITKLRATDGVPYPVAA